MLARKRDAGPVVLRRLNRAEYNNTIRDLVGLDLHPADDFPSDDVGYSFDNVADVLSTSPLLVEMYLAAADNVIAAAFAAPDIRERIMNPPADNIPLVFRRYEPPVPRSAREQGPQNRPGSGRPGAETRAATSTTSCALSPTGPSAGPPDTTR